jgi:membrane dipeptidase
MKFQSAIEIVDVFYEKVLASHKNIKLVTTKKEIANLNENEIGAVLTLEGCDAIDSDLTKLRTLFRLGVASIGLTWNNANATADGALESRGAGLSDFGRSVVVENNAHRVWTDVSHLSEAAFWDVIDIAEFPIASHSNAKRVSSHPRNLDDQQILALLSKKGVIGVTFVPAFLKEDGDAAISDILKHVEHVCSLGGEKQLGFGSDFEGISKTPEGLDNYKRYPLLVEALLKRYPEKMVKGFCFDNFFRNFPK